jgi:hypothetical protein
MNIPNETGGSREEKIARAAITKIREWLKWGIGRSPEEPLPRLAVKFCGGCNPELDRGRVIEIIREDLRGNFLGVSPDEETDFLLIMEGCKAACADRLEVKEKARYTIHLLENMVSAVEACPRATGDGS